MALLPSSFLPNSKKEHSKSFERKTILQRREYSFKKEAKTKMT